MKCISGFRVCALDCWRATEDKKKNIHNEAKMLQCPIIILTQRKCIASIQLCERSTLPKHSNDWRAYNGSLICVPWRMQHATSIAPSHQSSDY